MSGLFITLEGVEGSGKTTQLDRLKAHLESQGHAVDAMREPGGTAISEAIRTILLDPAHKEMSPATELLLYEAARAQLVAERIRPALEAGTFVLCDRFVDSTLAYQGGGRGLPEDMLRSLHDVATESLWPDVTIFVDVPVAEGLARIGRSRDLDRIELEETDFHERVRAMFANLADRESARIHRVDGTQSEEDVAQAIHAIVDESARAS